MTSSKSISWALTHAVSPRLTILDEVDSTNDWLLSQDRVTPLETAVSFNQRRGRGRLGRSWFFQPGDGLALSLVLPGLLGGSGDSLGRGIAPSLTVGVALQRALETVGLDHAGLKWPNDIVIGDNKLAGILCEFRQDGFLVAGVGINIRIRGFPPEFKATALEQHLAKPFELIDELVASFVREVDLSFQSTEKVRWESAAQRLSTLGREVEILPLNGQPTRGRAVALGKSGELIVERGDGSQVTVSSSDINHLYQ